MSNEKDAQKAKPNGSGSPEIEPGGYGEVWREIVADTEADGLPRRHKTFHLTYYSPYHDETFQGNFSIKKLTVAEIAQVGVRQAQLNSGQTGVNPVASMYNMWLAQFDYSITHSPNWWEPGEELDSNLLSTVFGKVVSFEDSFREVVERKLQAHKRAGKAKRKEQSEIATPTVVGQEVQAASNQ